MLAAWGNALLDGAVRPGDLVDAVTRNDAPHRVEGSPSGDGGLLEAILVLRRSQGRARLVLPVPGDVRGVPGPDEFRAFALDAGEAVLVPGVGLVPEVITYEPSSAPPTVTWHVYEIGPIPPDHLDLRQAQFELSESIRDAATALTAADVGGGSAGVLAALRDARRAGDDLHLPPDFPGKAVAMIAQTERLQAVLDLAAVDPLGGAVDRFGISARASGLRPLADAVRRARLAAYNATAG